MALPYTDPRLTDGVVLLRPWGERDAPLVERAARDEYDAADREVREETGLSARPIGLIGIYGFDHEEGRPHLLMYVFACDVVSGEAAVAAPRELAELGWFDPLRRPGPLERVAPVAIPDALAGRYGTVRLGLPHQGAS